MLVTGGTGTLGRPLVDLLTRAGRPVRVLSRRPRAAAGGPPVEWVAGDLATGRGVERAVDGAQVIVHCATSVRSRRVDVAGTGRLLEAERLVEGSRLPWTILRTTQFHDLLHRVLGTLSRPPLLLPRGLRFQPVDTREAAERLAALALGPPAGRVVDLGGPQVLTVEELAGGYLRATGRRRPVVRVHVPGATARGFRAGGHLCPEHPDGTRTWAEFLAARYQEGR